MTILLMSELPQSDKSSEKPGKGILIAMVVFAVLLVALVVYITVGYETAEDDGAALPAPERLEDSPVVPEGEPLQRPAPERDESTAPTPPRPEADPTR
jgi:hypothetical protein